MRLSVSTTLLTHRQCERSNPTKSGGKPPIRFVPEKLEDFDANKTNTVKIRMDDEVIKMFQTLKSGNAEAIVNLIREHESIVDDRKLREKYDAAWALWNTKRNAIKALDATSDADEIAKLEEQISDHKETCASSQQQAFGYFEKLLDPVNVQFSKWH